MPHLRALWRRLPTGHLCLAALLLFIAACSGTPGQYPQSTLEPRGEYARDIDGLFRTTVILATIVFVLVEGALLYAIFKFRGKPDDPEPHQTHGNTMVELIWTVIPAVVLAVVAVPTVRTILRTAEVPTGLSADGKPPLIVEVIGHQWWWEFRYPELGITTAGEIFAPKGRYIDLRMSSADVVHAFWVPQFSGKRDVFPKRTTLLWFVADTTGVFPGACTEFCGTQHARMDFNTVVVEPAEFDTWVATRQADSVGVSVLPKPAPKTAADSAALAAMDPVVREGEKMFQAKGCAGCHATNSAKAMSMVGPNLSGVGVRKMIASGWLPNTDENLSHWIRDPQGVKVGSKMILPEGVTVSEEDAKVLVAYLRTKR